MLKKLLLSCLAAIALAGLFTGCEKHDSAGDAVKDAGKKVQDAADDAAH